MLIDKKCRLPFRQPYVLEYLQRLRNLKRHYFFVKVHNVFHEYKELTIIRWKVVSNIVGFGIGWFGTNHVGFITTWKRLQTSYQSTVSCDISSFEFRQILTRYQSVQILIINIIFVAFIIKL